MVSVHNSSLFDELREDAMSNLPDNGNNEPLYDELDDQFEEDLNIQSPRMNRLNMQKMQSSASNYFANKTSPQSNNIKCPLRKINAIDVTFLVLLGFCDPVPKNNRLIFG